VGSKNYRNKSILKHARGQACTFQSPWCNNNPETTVFCHLDEHFAGKGRGLKAHDFAGFFGCSGCHRYYEGGHGHDIRDFLALRAVIRTLEILFSDGIIS